MTACRYTYGFAQTRGMRAAVEMMTDLICMLIVEENKKF